ncbi:MAG: TetR/AcrR family transcriptional regulator [Bacillota bacterium]
MVKNRMERKKEETKKKIVTVAMDLFKRQGFDSTTVEQIAEEADIAKGTIYLHFPVKEAIIDEYVRTAVRERESNIIHNMRELPDTRARLIAFYLKSLEFAEKMITKDLHRRYLVYRVNNLGQSVKDQNLRSGISGVLSEIIELGQEKGEVRKDISAEMLAEQLQSANFFTFMVWLIEPDKFSLPDRITLNVDLFLKGAAAGSSV